MARHRHRSWRRVATAAAAGLLLLTAVILAASSATASSSKQKTLRIAYLSYAVANPYDAPMLAAARSAASARNAKVTVFDANNSADTQFAQFQDVITVGKSRYDGIIVQPIFGPALVGLARKAIAKGIKVGNVDQILGADYTTAKPQVKGLAANVVFVPATIGQKLGALTVRACARRGSGDCEVGYMYGFKASGVDKSVRSNFDKVIAAKSNIKVVAEAEAFFSTAGGLTATQDMLQAQPDLDLIVGTDQSTEGSRQAFKAAGKTGILLIGWGGSAIGLAAVKSGTQFADVMTLPGSEGQLVAEDLIRAIRTGKNQPGQDPVAKLPDAGVVTRSNVRKFTPEYPG